MSQHYYVNIILNDRAKQSVEDFPTERFPLTVMTIITNIFKKIIILVQTKS